jgi:hypothetical protein
MNKRLRRRDWLIATAVSLLTALLLLLPYWLAYTTAVPDTTFTGVLMNPEDSQTYFAKMLNGYDGSWFYTIPFTPERPQPAFLGAFYVALGRLARLLDLSLQTVWHAARFLTGFIMFLTIFYFIRRQVTERRTQWVAFLLAVFGSGFGWLLFLLNQPYWLDAFPVDFKMPEAHPFFSALTFPHIALATAVILLSFHFLLRVFAHPHSSQSWRDAVVAGIFLLLLGLLHPIMIYLMIAIWGFYWILLAAQARRVLWRRGFLLVAAFAIPGLLYVYYAYSLFADPVLAAWNNQRQGTVSPPWPHYLIAFGPFLLLAALHARRALRNPKSEIRNQSFLWIWTATTVALIYAPLSSQRRFIQGVHIPLAIFAAAGFTHVVLPWLESRRFWQALLRRPRYEAGKMRVFITALFILFMSLSNLYVFASVSVSAVIQQPDPLFRPTAEIEATRWLRRNARPDAVVLGAYQTGNYVAAHSGLRAVVGHWAETGNFAEKETAVTQFFAADTSPAARQAILDRYDVAYIWHGPRERELGAFDPATLPGVDPVYQDDSITIYRRETVE